MQLPLLVEVGVKVSIFGIAAIVRNAGDCIGVSCMCDGVSHMWWQQPDCIGVSHVHIVISLGWQTYNLRMCRPSHRVPLKVLSTPEMPMPTMYTVMLQELTEHHCTSQQQ